MSNFNFVVLDPRPVGAEANDKVFASGPVYGLEVTIPALAARCVANLDPQHTGGDATLASIELALTADLPPEGAILATVRPDLDSVGAMAVLSIRARGESLESAVDRIRLVADADKFVRAGGYPGPQPLPTTDNPWPKTGASAEAVRELAAMAAAVADFKVPMVERVSVMGRWLLTGEEPESYRQKVESERADLIRALESGEIIRQLVAGGKVAVVESTHRAATMVGYSLAPVVVALNPSFRLGGGEAHRKFTICAYSAQFADIRSALAELAELEPGWGGSPTIGGSPQGVSSVLTTNQVVGVLAKHLK